MTSQEFTYKIIVQYTLSITCEDPINTPEVDSALTGNLLLAKDAKR